MTEIFERPYHKGTDILWRRYFEYINISVVSMILSSIIIATLAMDINGQLKAIIFQIISLIPTYLYVKCVRTSHEFTLLKTISPGTNHLFITILRVMVMNLLNYYLFHIDALLFGY